MTKQLLHAAAVAASTVLAAWAGDISGPVAGFLFDAPSRAVRPILGIPGASTIGQPLDLGFEVALAAVAPAQDYLLAAGTDGKTRLVRLAGGLETRVLDTLHGAPVRIAISPRGTAAVLVNADTMDVYTGLPGAPALARTIGLATAPVALAVSDDGEAVLATFDGTLSVAGASAEWKAAGGSAGVALAAFAPASHDAAVVTREGAVAVYRAIGEGSGGTVLTAPDGGIDSAAGVAFSADGKVLVASASARTVSIFDAATSSRSDIGCACVPSGLAAMGAVYRLNELADAPLWLLDPRGEQPQLIFVPAPSASAVTEGAAAQ